MEGNRDTVSENNISNGDASPARRVAAAWENTNAKNLDGFYSTEVHGQRVQIGHIEYGSEGDLEWVDVWFGKPVGSPAFRILNPDTLVEDWKGDVLVEEDDGKGGTRKHRYREDPLQAVAETISDVRSGR